MNQADNPYFTEQLDCAVQLHASLIPLALTTNYQTPDSGVEIALLLSLKLRTKETRRKIMVSLTGCRSEKEPMVCPAGVSVVCLRLLSLFLLFVPACCR